MFDGATAKAKKFLTDNIVPLTAIPLVSWSSNLLDWVGKAEVGVKGLSWIVGNVWGRGVLIGAGIVAIIWNERRYAKRKFLAVGLDRETMVSVATDLTNQLRDSLKPTVDQVKNLVAFEIAQKKLEALNQFLAERSLDPNQVLTTPYMEREQRFKSLKIGLQFIGMPEVDVNALRHAGLRKRNILPESIPQSEDDIRRYFVAEMTEVRDYLVGLRQGLENQVRQGLVGV